MIELQVNEKYGKNEKNNWKTIMCQNDEIAQKWTISKKIKNVSIKWRKRLKISNWHLYNEIAQKWQI